MTQKDLIIALLAQDLKHSQLLLGLDDLGLSASLSAAGRRQTQLRTLRHHCQAHARTRRRSRIELGAGVFNVYVTCLSADRESREVTIEHTSSPMFPFALECFEDLTQALVGKGG